MTKLKPQPVIDRIFGLFGPTGQEKIALCGVAIDSRVAALGQETTISQRWRNDEKTAIEALYTYPLPNDGAVCGFEVRVGDRLIHGELDEAEAAMETYDNAIADGNGAYLLEQQRPDVFTINVGNMLPGQEAEIRIRLISALDVQDDSLRLEFPATMAPRYVPAADHYGPQNLEKMADAEALNPPQRPQVPYGLSLRVELAPGPRVVAVQSPTHQIVSHTGEAGWTVALRAEETAMDRAVVLQVDLAHDAEPSVQIAPGAEDDEGFVAVTFWPEFDLPEAPEPAEIVFVIDCSGSMEGSSIEQARQALELCLRSLQAGDRFNIIRFGSNHDAFAKTPVVYDQTSFDKALSYIRKTRADYGGTEILRPLRWLMETAPARDHRDVIVLTDGQVSNEPAVLEYVQSQRGRNRIFSFGIGPASSHFLVDGLASRTRGKAEYITGDERIEDKVLRCFSRLGSPALDELTLDWGDANVDCSPSEPPPVFDGDAVRVYARVRGDWPRTVTLRTRSGANRADFHCDIPPRAAASVADTPLALLWARGAIAELEQRVGDRLDRRDRQRKKLVALSKQYGIQCSATSYVAVEERSAADKNDGLPELRRVPVMTPVGWGGGMVLAAGAPMPAAACGSVILRSHSVKAKASKRSSSHSFLGGFVDGLMSFAAGSSADDDDADTVNQMAEGLRAEEAPGAPIDANDLHAILRSQSFNGDYCHPVAELDAVRDWVRQRPDVRIDDDAVLRTFAALVVLRLQHAHMSDVWKGSATKAARWLGHETGWGATRVETLVSDCLASLAEA